MKTSAYKFNITWNSTLIYMQTGPRMDWRIHITKVELIRRQLKHNTNMCTLCVIRVMTCSSYGTLTHDCQQSMTLARTRLKQPMQTAYTPTPPSPPPPFSRWTWIGQFSPSFLPQLVLQEHIWRSGKVFYRPNVLLVSRPTVSEHCRTQMLIQCNTKE